MYIDRIPSHQSLRVIFFLKPSGQKTKSQVIGFKFVNFMFVFVGERFLFTLFTTFTSFTKIFPFPPHPLWEEI